MALQQPKRSITNAAFSPLSIVRMLWKRKWTIAAVWVIVTAAVMAAVSRIPLVYRAEALIVVDSQKIPDRYVSSTVVSDAQDRLSAISQEINSSGRLEKIIEDFDLYHAERQTHFQEDILSMMRRDTEVSAEKTWNGRTNAFRISYQGGNAKIVADVTNKIASLYVEENLKTRETQAAGTTEFIDTQLKEAKQKLDELESAVSQYKLRHNGELPQQEASLNGMLSRLTVALEANRDAMNRAQQQKVMLQDSISVTEAAAETQRRGAEIAAAPTTPTPAANPGTTAKPVSRLQELESQLTLLRARYSDNYPDVSRLRALIAEVRRDEERKAADSPAPARAAESVSPAAAPVASAARKAPPADAPGSTQASERIASLRSQLDLVNQELESRKREQQRIVGDLNLYQGRVNGLPIREQEMAALTRDYEISKTNYRSLLDKKMAAEMATDMERREKSERFTIVDPARVPTKPYKPNRKLLDAGGAFVGLVLGLALALGKEMQAGTLLGEWELPAGTTVLGRLPYIEIIPHEALVRKG